jgi:hypothetical protein
MKRETFRHPKILDLSSRLQCTRPEAIGYLTLLWDFTAEYAIQGDIGKHADGAIARACDYQGDPEKFIQALVDARWLDIDPDHRLLIHDWSEHCERWVKLKIQKIGKTFILSFAKRSIEASTETPVIDITEASPSCDQSNPIQSNPIQTEGAEKSATTLPAGLNLEAWGRWLEFRRKAGFKPYKTDETAKSLAQHPPDAQAAAVQHSIENQYQGLFPEKFTGGPNGKTKQPREHLTPLQRVEKAHAERQ